MRRIAITGICMALMAVVALPLLAQDDKEVEKRQKKAPELLPDSTLVYLQVNDAAELKKKFGESTMGKMMADEKMRPFVEGMMGVAKESYEDIKEQLAGQELDSLLNLPQGEICFGLVGMAKGQPVPVFFMDIDPEQETHKKLIERGREFAEEEGATIETEEFEGLEIHTVQGDDEDPVCYFQHQNTYVFSSNKDLLTFIWLQWQDKYEGKQKTLSKNRKFATIMNRCRGTKETPPEFSFFVDPIETYKAYTKGSIAAAAVYFLPTLGLDGLKGVGGSVIYGEQGYDSIMHAHVLLASPRNGIFKMLALKSGINDPEPWVPADCISYITMHLQAKTLYQELTKIVDAFYEEGSFEKMVDENINQQIDIDFEEDLINSLDGRISLVTWSVPPSRLNSQAMAFSVKIKDMKKFQEVLDKWLEKIDEMAEGAIGEYRYKGVSYFGTSEKQKEERKRQVEEWRERRRREQGRENEPARVRLTTRNPDPCYMIIDDYLIISESPEFLKHIIDVNKGDKDPLANDEEYKKVVKDMEKLLTTRNPSVTFFNRPAEQMRTLFEAAKSDNTRDLLDQESEENKYLKKLKYAMEDTPLPDFEYVKKYFPPAGGFVVNEDSGFHFLIFGRKPKLDEDESSDEDN